jgi:hypothetical protein
MELLLTFFSYDGVGLTLGVIIASGMIVGTSMIYLGMGWRQILGWVIAFFVLATFVEGIRLEVFYHHGEPYSILPFLTIFIPFTFYVTGIVPGALIAKHYCKDEKDYIKDLLKEYEEANGNAGA